MLTRLPHLLTVGAALALLSGPLRAESFNGDPEQLTKGDVERIVANAATEAARINPRAVIAVTDREGFVLAVWDMAGRFKKGLPGFSLTDDKILRQYGILVGAITRAGTAAFLSSDQEAFTSRTGRLHHSAALSSGRAQYAEWPAGRRRSFESVFLGRESDEIHPADDSSFPRSADGFFHRVLSAESAGNAFSWGYPRL